MHICITLSSLGYISKFIPYALNARKQHQIMSKVNNETPSPIDSLIYSNSILLYIKQPFVTTLTQSRTIHRNKIYLTQPHLQSSKKYHINMSKIHHHSVLPHLVHATFFFFFFNHLTPFSVRYETSPKAARSCN